MVEVRRVALPGVGMLHSFTTIDGVEVAVIAHRSGRSDLIVRPVGAEHSVEPVRLDEDEAGTLADLLGGTEIIESITDLGDMPGVPMDWFTVRVDDDVAGRTVGEFEAYARAVEVIALVRDQRATTTPADDAGILAGDVLVVVGPSDQVATAFRTARGTSVDAGDLDA